MSKGWQRVRATAERTLATDESSATAHEALAQYFGSCEYNWPQADKELTQARALKSGSVSTQFVIGRFAFARGRYEEARQLMDATLSVDPLNPLIYQVAAWKRYLRGDLTGGESLIRRSIALSPTFLQSHFVFGAILIARGELQSALAQMQAETPEGGRDEGIALVYQALARKADSDAACARFMRDYAAAQPEGIAKIYAARQHSDKAFEWLDKAYAVGDAELLFAPDNPVFRSLHADPRWRALLRKTNLADLP